MLVFISLLVQLSCVLVCADSPKVVLEDGVVTGMSMTTVGGRSFSAFMGIPFAKPPLGELRFKPPLPNDPWKKVLNATVVHAVCPQRDVYRRTTLIEGDEDCLYLNVYTPELPKKNASLLPVMVFLHGGGWLCGGGNSKWYGPDALLDKDIVLVVPNYRLGALGFLSTGDKVMPGNNGLKDQNLALKWVKRNIRKFGGNPDSVTLFGESAGGSSAHFHMVSPMSKGLFHKVIAQSGTAFVTWAISAKGENVENSKKLARIFKCPEKPSTKMVECLRKVNAFDIIAQDRAFMEWDYDPMIPFKPVIEPNDTEGAFLPESPEDVISSGRGADVPLITGITKEDGALRVAGMIKEPHLIKEFNDGFDHLAPMSLMYGSLTNNPAAVTKRLKEFYFNDEDIKKSDIKNLIHLFTDGWFLNGADEAVRYHLEFSKQPVYYYLFGHRGTSSFTEIFGAGQTDLGTCHADDLQYLFPLDDLFGKQLSDEDKKIRELLVTLWTNFATFGDPTPSLNGVVKEKWEPVTTEKMQYYNIDSKSQKMMLGLLIDRAELWRSFCLRKGLNKVKEEL